MAIKVTSLGGTDWVDGEILYADDLIDTFEAEHAFGQETIILLDDVTTNSDTYELKKTITASLPPGQARTITFYFDGVTTVSNANPIFSVTKNTETPGGDGAVLFGTIRETNITTNTGAYNTSCSVVVTNGSVIRLYIKKGGANTTYGCDVFLTKPMDTSLSIT